jgi:hypothetical protein
MGEGLWGGIVKGPVHRVVDAFVNHKDAAGQYDNRAAFLAAVGAHATADDYLTYLGTTVKVPPRDTKYLSDWWYNQGKTGFWPYLQPIFPILQEGLIKAVEAAQAPPAVPLDSYWISTGHQVEVAVTRSQYQVTRIIVTPGTPPPTNMRVKQSDVWMVRRGLGLNQGDPSDPKKGAVVEKVKGNVITWRVWDLPDDPNQRQPTTP